MMNVLIDMPVHQPSLYSLQAMDGIKVDIIENPEQKVRALPVGQIKACDILFCTFPPENHQEMSNLKMIQISSAGYNQLIGQKFEERNIKTCNATGISDIPIAEWNIAMMINLTRDLPRLVRNQSLQIWDRDARFQREIRGSTVGIWGYGGIGRETARLAKALGMKVHVLSRRGVGVRENMYCVPGTGDPEGKLFDRVFLMHEKEAFLKDLDFLILSIPLTSGTEGIIGRKELQMLDPKTFLLNPARGPLVREDALICALREGWIAGAALDTHYYYPMPPDHPFWHMPNVIMTPHISGSSGNQQFRARVWDLFVQNVKRLQNGEPLLNELILTTDGSPRG